MTETAKITVSDTFGNYLLKGMVEIGRPAAVPFSFDAPGWWILSALLLFGACLLSWRIFQWFKRNRYRRYGRSELVRLRNLGCAEEIPQILRRVAMEGFGRETVVPLTGQNWIEFLNQTGRDAPFDAVTGRLLLDLAYGPPMARDESEKARLFDSAERWILSHRRQGQ